MKLDNEFPVGVPIERAWEVLTDLELIAPCMPGAQLTGVNDGVYTGKVKIKVGPVTAEYAGTAQFTVKDDSAYSAVINARGRDSRGQGNATAIISARLRSEGASTVVNVDTDLSIAGRIAQFGSGMIKEVSARLLTQFVQCLEQKLNAAGPPEQDEGSTAEEAATATAAASSPGTAAGPAGDAVTGTGMAGDGMTSGPAAEPAPLNLMSVAGGAVYKRLVPLVVVAVIAIIIIIVLVAG